MMQSRQILFSTRPFLLLGFGQTFPGVTPRGQQPLLSQNGTSLQVDVCLAPERAFLNTVGGVFSGGLVYKFPW